MAQESGAVIPGDPRVRLQAKVEQFQTFDFRGGRYNDTERSPGGAEGITTTVIDGACVIGLGALYHSEFHAVLGPKLSAREFASSSYFGQYFRYSATKVASGVVHKTSAIEVCVGVGQPGDPLRERLFGGAAQ